MVDSQDLEQLKTLRPWAERAQLADHPEGAELVWLGLAALCCEKVPAITSDQIFVRQRMDKLSSATAALQSALDVVSRLALVLECRCNRQRLSLIELWTFASKGTGPAFREALWKSEEAVLDPARCEMLQTPRWQSTTGTVLCSKVFVRVFVSRLMF